MKVIIKKYTYRGHKIVGLFMNEDDAYPVVSFGLTKWKLILDNLEEIKQALEE